MCLGAKVLGPHPRAVVWSHWAPEGEEGVMDVEAGTRHPPPRAIQPCSSTHLPPLSLPSCLSQVSVHPTWGSDNAYYSLCQEKKKDGGNEMQVSGCLYFGLVQCLALSANSVTECAEQC